MNNKQILKDIRYHILSYRNRDIDAKQMAKAIEDLLNEESTKPSNL
jgi:hypothetical protein|tara:strand:+ start:949 stop:1086 length:138 start_codon:yes stop_codon:yes gene_type:complete